MKNIALLHCSFGTPSAVKLEERLKQLGVDLTRTHRSSEVPKNTDLLIRWGHTLAVSLKRNAIQINTAQSIELGSNKSRARAALQNAGVSVPKSYFSKNQALNSNSNVKYPLFGRPSYHTQGKDVEFIKNRKDLLNSEFSEYFSEFIPKEREFRVYVFGGKSLGVVEKIPEKKNDITWNSHRGATFYDLQEGEYPPEIINEAIKAADVIGQYFSGVDLMTYKSKPYIIELNSSIGLSNAHRVEIFAQAFKRLIDNSL